MRNRILSALRKWALASDAELREILYGITINNPATDTDIAHAREIFFKYIDNPEILKIKTIHGFCEEILRRFPTEAGISPSWSLVSDATQRILLQETFNKLINSPSNASRVYDAFTHIVDRISENYISELLDVPLSKLLDFRQ
jgi:ATP-dependent helicase/nuclease subunit A